MLTPSELQAAAIPYGCLYNARSAALYLLGRIAGVTDPETIALNSAGFNLPISNETAMLFLLAQMAGVTNLDEIISGSAGYSGINERAATLYLAEVIASNGTTGGGTGIDWAPDNTVALSLSLKVSGVLTLHSLVTVIGSVGLSGIAATEISAPKLVSIGGDIEFDSAPDLTRVSLPVLATVVGRIASGGDPLLTDVSFPALLPTDGTDLDFNACALSVASVNHILARCVANLAYVSGTVDLSGGTSAAPAGQGAADVITLTGRGVTVTTN